MKLTCYAPGDGALAFTYTEQKWNHKSGQLENLASSKQITRSDIETYLKGESEKYQSYLIVQLGEEKTETRTVERFVEQPVKKGRGRPRKNGSIPPVMTTETIEVKRLPQFRLCAPVVRIGANLLQLGDSVYAYKVDIDNIFWTRDRLYTDYNLSITTKHREDDEEFEVKNISTRSALRWFLNHEQTIVEQYPEQNKATNEAVSTINGE